METPATTYSRKCIYTMGQNEVFQYSSNVAHESLSHVAKKRKRKGALCINYMTQYFENIFGNIWKRQRRNIHQPILPKKATPHVTDELQENGRKTNEINDGEKGISLVCVRLIFEPTHRTTALGTTIVVVSVGPAASLGISVTVFGPLALFFPLADALVQSLVFKLAV